MKTEMHTPELVAIEESSLETVTGGWGKPSLKLKLDVVKQKNELIFAGNAIAVGGDFTFYAEQTNAAV